ncbi:DUF1697 domain-containing protein [Rubripirellula amarantea]|nr:DUF1697 domain-containing protein [Rubripirellula amarantea]
MTTWIALFRGINVGGKNKMPMTKLKATLESAGLKDVRTYIQSGNVVFESSLKSKKSLATRILDPVESEFGFRPPLMLLTNAELKEAMRVSPFQVAETEGKTLHFFFMDEDPKSPDLASIAELAVESESHALVGSVFYLCAPAGIGRSKLAAAAERKLGVPATARNFNTVSELNKMADS